MTANGRTFRVLHAPYDVGGNSLYLARAESELGFGSSTLVYFKQWFGYAVDEDMGLAPGADPLKHPRWWAAMLKVLRSVDVLHFNFGGSFLTDVGRGRIYMDLPLWRALGIRTFVSFQGCDSRISEYCMKNFTHNACRNCRSRPFCEGTYDTFKRECISQLTRHFDGVFSVNPDLMHNIPGARFLPYSNCDVDNWRPPKGFDWHHSRPVRILHAPTWREIKGSDVIIKAVEELKNEGENVEMVLVEKVPHDEVREVYESCDILVDQVLAGWYGGLAVELMALGKPVVAYIREGDLKFLPAAMREQLPVLSAEPDTLKDVLRSLIRSSQKRRDLGARSRRYVENWHHPRVVAQMTTAAYAQALEKEQPRRQRNKRTVLARRLFASAVARLTKLYLQTSVVKSLVRRLTTSACSAAFYLLLPLVWLRSFLRLKVGRPASVWGTTPILTTPLLSRGDRMLGLSSETVVYTVYHITKAFDRNLKPRIDFICRHVPYLLNAYYRCAFLRALLRYDVFHFFYDQGFLERDGRFGINRTELKWLSMAGKRTYLYAYGADVRTRQATSRLGQYHCCLHCNAVGVHCICDDAVAKAKVDYCRKYATALVSMSDMMTYVPGARNVNYWPIDTDRVPFAGATRDHSRPLKVLHIPNHEWAKGTSYLKKALRDMAAEGTRVELIQVTGRPNKEVLDLMSQADVIADQFLGLFGYTALEAMAVGKVVLCYIPDPDMLLGPEERPVISVNPDNLKATLTEIANWPRERFEELGQAGRRYVQKYYSLQAVACRMAEMYKDTASFPARVVDRIGRNAEALAAENRAAADALSEGAYSVSPSRPDSRDQHGHRRSQGERKRSDCHER